MMKALIVCLLFTLGLTSTTLKAEEIIISGKNVELQALLLKPQNIQKGAKLPAIVMLHGCGGLYNKGHILNPRHADWAQRYVDKGYVVLMPESFASRGFGSLCKTSNRQVRTSVERPKDAHLARQWLQSQDDIDSKRIHLLGWSNGGTTVLNAIKPKFAPNDAPNFSKAVAFYPGCRSLAEKGDWTNSVKLLLLIGEADQWTPIEPCATLYKTRKGKGALFVMKSYPNAHHDFDHPSLALTKRTGLAYTADGSGEAYVGTHDGARAQSIQDVAHFLK